MAVGGLTPGEGKWGLREETMTVRTAMASAFVHTCASTCSHPDMQGQILWPILIKCNRSEQALEVGLPRRPFGPAAGSRLRLTDRATRVTPRHRLRDRSRIVFSSNIFLETDLIPAAYSPIIFRRAKASGPALPYVS